MSYLNLSWPQRARLKRLLKMEYTLKELADEIGCARSQIDHAVSVGCPTRETEGGRRFVIGDEFAQWYESLLAERKQPLAPDEAYCLRCRAPVRVVDVAIAACANGVERVTGRCGKCGGMVNRYRRAE
jgi:hypothetical protein